MAETRGGRILVSLSDLRMSSLPHQHDMILDVTRQLDEIIGEKGRLACV